MMHLNKKYRQEIKSTEYFGLKLVTSHNSVLFSYGNMCNLIIDEYEILIMGSIICNKVLKQRLKQIPW